MTHWAVHFDFGGPVDGSIDVCSVPPGYQSPPDVIEVDGISGVEHYYEAYAKSYTKHEAYYRYIGTKKPDHLIPQN